MIDIFSHTQESYAEAIFAILKKGKNHAKILYSEWYRAGKFLKDVEPQAQALADQIIALTSCSLPTLSRVNDEGDTIKFLLQFADGLECETVSIPMQAGRTLCLSCQIGCARACSFCETGRMGLVRNMTVAEIVAQVFVATFTLKMEVRNLVFMGMGEPFDNFDAVMQAIAIITDPTGLALGPSHISVSTSGHVDGLIRFQELADPAINLAVSIHAPTDEIRKSIMPINRKWNLAALKAAMQDYCENPRRQIFIEYLMLQGVNDSLECADLLAEYLQGLRVKVNVIPYNPQSKARYETSKPEQIDAFMQRLREKGYQALIRHSKGERIMAACGQLGNLQLRKTRTRGYAEEYIKIGENNGR